MKSKDILSQKTRELSQKILAAVKDGNQDGVALAFADFQEFIAQQNSSELEMAIEQMNGAILANRGVKQLTSEEKDFFQKLIDASASSDPRQTITNLTKAMPETVYDTVIQDIKDNHELFNYIDLQNTNGVIKMIINTGDVDLATWDALNTAITKELSAAIDVLDLTLCKLSAFFIVPKDMTDLGPAWLLTLVTTVLSEASARGLEKAVIDGTGKNQPIGMTRDLNGSVTLGVYPKKTPIVLNEITPASYNAVVARLARKPYGGYRSIPEVVLILNPVDYLTKVLPATTVRAADGTYKTDIFPYPTKVIQSAQLEVGEAIIGLGKKYFLGVGSDSKDGKIEYDDSCQFIQDNRVYKIKFLGNGRPKDNNAFELLDISNLQPATYKVEVVNTSAKPIPTNEVSALLKSLKIGNKALTPVFASATKEYTLTTTDASNTITAEAVSPTATVSITNNLESVTNASAATWNEGENTLKITVTDGADIEVYTVTVTKS